MINCFLSCTQGSQGFQGFPGANGEKGTRVCQLGFLLFFSLEQVLDQYQCSTRDRLVSRLLIYPPRRSSIVLNERFLPRTERRSRSFFITTYASHFKPHKALFSTWQYLSNVSFSLFKGWAINLPTRVIVFHRKWSRARKAFHLHKTFVKFLRPSTEEESKKERDGSVIKFICLELESHAEDIIVFLI